MSRSWRHDPYRREAGHRLKRNKSHHGSKDLYASNKIHTFALIREYEADQLLDVFGAIKKLKPHGFMRLRDGNGYDYRSGLYQIEKQEIGRFVEERQLNDVAAQEFFNEVYNEVRSTREPLQIALSGIRTVLNNRTNTRTIALGMDKESTVIVQEERAQILSLLGEHTTHGYLHKVRDREDPHISVAKIGGNTDKTTINMYKNKIGNVMPRMLRLDVLRLID